MTKGDIRAVIERVLSWPTNRQEEAAELLLAMEASEGEYYHPTEEESAAIQEGLRQAERGEFASDQEMEEFFRKWTR